jgi:5-methylcytosine-specific restriction endonuclease McrA
VSAGAFGEEWTTVSALARVDPAPLEPLQPERYKVQFTATEEYVRLVEEAKALLSHAVPNVTLEELHMRAMRALVAELKKKKYAASGDSASGMRDSANGMRDPAIASCSVDGLPALARDLDAADTLPRIDSRTRGERTDTLDQHDQHRHDEYRHDQHDPPHQRRRGRHIPAAVRRAIFQRDGARCTYLDANGARCRETHRLEFHHLEPFALGGDHRPSNLTLRCAAHNALAAEQDFGRELIEDAKASLGHEPFGRFMG